MNWQIELYEKSNGKCPVLDYIQTLSPKQRARIEKEIDLLKIAKDRMADFLEKNKGVE